LKQRKRREERGVESDGVRLMGRIRMREGEQEEVNKEKRVLGV
jgi:hypothetical protein